MAEAEVPSEGRGGARSASRYLLEGATIVASILLALFAESAWEWGRDRAEEGEIMAQLAEEFERAEWELQADREAREWMQTDVTALVRLREASAAERVHVPLDTLQGHFWALLSYRFYTPGHPVLDDILSSGRIELLRSDRLRQALQFYEAERRRIAQIDRDEIDYANTRVEPFLAQRLDLTRLMDEGRPADDEALRAQLEALVRDPAFGSLLYGKQDRTEQAMRFSLRVGAAVDSVQAALGGL